MWNRGIFLSVFRANSKIGLLDPFDKVSLPIVDVCKSIVFLVKESLFSLIELIIFKISGINGCSTKRVVIVKAFYPLPLLVTK
nr:MAG TPA: hypothetical protein [Caudoviricetes sp.]